MTDQIARMKTVACPEASDRGTAVPEEFFLGRFIPLHYHYNMLLDRDRVDGFREAIHYVVRPGAKVLELGGGTGVLSFFAAAQAEKVWCVERNPALADAARAFLAKNTHGDRVEVVADDAMNYLPPEPVDVVICEMLHVGLLREKQVAVIQSFKDRYVRQFGNRLPRFIPEASLLAVQAVEQTYDFAGFYAPIPIFQTPAPSHEGTTDLADPVIYRTLCYDEPLPRQMAWEGTMIVNRDGLLNALRLVTKNVLAILVDQQRAVPWWNQYLVLPLDEPIAVKAGQRVRVGLNYNFGGQLESLEMSATLATTAVVQASRRPVVGCSLAN